jgi:hypothetical protein
VHWHLKVGPKSGRSACDTPCIQGGGSDAPNPTLSWTKFIVFSSRHLLLRCCFHRKTKRPRGWGARSDKAWKAKTILLVFSCTETILTSFSGFLLCPLHTEHWGLCRPEEFPPLLCHLAWHTFLGLAISPVAYSVWGSTMLTLPILQQWTLGLHKCRYA